MGVIFMKRLLIILLGAMLLVACGADNEYEQQRKEAEKQLEESKAELEKVKEVSKQIDETSDLLKELQKEMGIEEDPTDESIGITAAEVAELIAYEALGEGDSITNVEIYDGEIKMVIEISDDAIISDKSLLAETIYSRAGDALLEHEGWEVLTVEFVDVGEVSMLRDEKDTNEYGMDYFPLEKIIGQLE